MNALATRRSCHISVDKRRDYGTNAAGARLSRNPFVLLLVPRPVPRRERGEDLIGTDAGVL